MKIVMIASECRPLIKTGGLADVVYSLSKELVSLNEEVSIIIPFYGQMKGTVTRPKLIAKYLVRMSWRNAQAKVYEATIDGINYYLIDNEQYFNRGYIYGDNDDGERFAFFALAAKELISQLNLAPDIVHVHDWQAGMVPCLCKEERPMSRDFLHTKFVFTIHNPAFQGQLDRSALRDLYNLDESLYDNGKLRFNDRVSTLKAGIVYSDKITTVSPTHRNELLTPEGSMGLCGVLRLREWDFTGYLNGIDYDEFDPSKDKKIYETYSLKTIHEGKMSNKKAFLNDHGLKNMTKPLFGLVSRLTWQKGINVLLPACYELASKGCNIAILGSGEPEAEREMEILRARYPYQVTIYIGYNDELAHKIYAASDFFLMPSLFEPCGIGQMIAQRYGTLPIVRRTGGLRDSVIGYHGTNLETANGIQFDEYSGEAFKNTCKYALDVYNKRNVFKTLRENAIQVDNSWAKSAKLYLQLYKSLKG